MHDGEIIGFDEGAPVIDPGECGDNLTGVLTDDGVLAICGKSSYGNSAYSAVVSIKAK